MQTLRQAVDPGQPRVYLRGALEFSRRAPRKEVGDLWTDIGMHDGSRGRAACWPSVLAEDQGVRAGPKLRDSGRAAGEGDQLLEMGADRAAGTARSKWLSAAANVAMPVPLHGYRKRQRNYEQANCQADGPKACLPHKPLMRGRPGPNKRVLSFAQR